ncbi:MAG TPA: hypothetical protein PK269_08230 [Bacteroidales bacterium]|nr:hypothetical protein [Bacteroidales bacterium]
MTSAHLYFFEEGQEYEFTVHSRLKFPPEDEKFLVLISPFNTRHLLKEKPFENYHLAIGRQLKCRIDKINCTGKIFLEPEHPYYKEHAVYDFPVKGLERITNSGGIIELMLVVEDCWGKTVYINIEGEGQVYAGEQTVRCRVDRIKKGKLYLTPVNNMQYAVAYEPGLEYVFRIHRIVTLAEDEEYFELIDESANVHYLRKKYYTDYHFDIGDSIKCRFVAQPAAFRHYLEPVHPRYKIGEQYDFLYSGNETYVNESGEEIKKIMVTDGSEKDFFVSCDDFAKLQIEPGSTIRCLLKNIKMGRLVLECV